MTSTQLRMAAAALALGGAAALYINSPSSGAVETCERLEKLCGEDNVSDDCAETVDGASEAEREDLLRCVRGSCLETVGCMSGTVLRHLDRGFRRGLLVE